MRIWISLLPPLATLSSPALASAAPMTVTDGTIEMRVDPAMPVLGCIVTRTSGDAAADTAACRRTEDKGPRPPGALPPETGFSADAEGRFVRCDLPDAAARPADFERQCAAELQRLRLARSMVPLDWGTWLTDADLAGGRVRVTARLGIDGEGRPTYCLIAMSSGNSGIDALVCPTLLRRARFRAARDIEGRPMPSVFNATFDLGI